MADTATCNDPQPLICNLTGAHTVCHMCGVPMQRAGACSVCPLCGDTSGCS